MPHYLTQFLRRLLPRARPLPGMVPNSAGGHAYPVDDWTRLDRFLVLGAEGGTYYATERALVRENAQGVLRVLAADGPRAVHRAVEISEAGRAPRNDPALFVLALAAAAEDAATRRLALAALPRVARTGTHLFRFAGFADSQRGWGRALRRAVASWYLDGSVERLAYQLVKYGQREGWSHRDLLRLAHPVTADPARRALFDWVCRRPADAALPALAVAASALSRSTDAAGAAALIRAHDLPREAVPTPLLNAPEVWQALLAQMPQAALLRSLAKLSAVGVLRPLSAEADQIAARLADPARIAGARLHPLAYLLALRTYAAGRGDRGRLVWEPVPAVVDALQAGFHAAFRQVEPTGRRLLLALDVSGSMAGGRVAGSALTPRDAAAAMALVTLAREPRTHVVGFTAASGVAAWRTDAALTPLPLSGSMRLDQAVEATARLPFGGTDCALPMLHALERGLSVDGFVVYTDSETWAGKVQPVEALRRYRERTGIPAKLIVVGLVSNGFSIADPEDGGMLDVVGFDAAAPQVMADFLR